MKLKKVEKMDLHSLESEENFINIVIKTLHTIKDLVYVVKVENCEFTYIFANKAGSTYLSNSQFFVGKTFRDVLSEEKANHLRYYYEEVAKYNKIVRYEENVEI